MLRLHYAPDNASLIIRIALEELGLAYETVLVDRQSSAQKSPAYKALNPRGQIPTLETPHGPIFETAAILLWLTECAECEGATNAQGLYTPRPGDPDRGAFLAWLFALSNGVQSELRGQFYTHRYVGPAPDAIAIYRARASARLCESLDQLDSLATARHPWFCAACDPTNSAAPPSVIDIYVAVMLRWMALYPADGCDWFHLSDRPALHALAKRLETRASVAAAARAEGLGPTPFSAPPPAKPPEGTAT